MPGRLSRLPSAGARRAEERLERLDPADAAAGGSRPTPTESFGTQDAFGRAWCQPKRSVCGQRNANDGDMSQRPKESSAKEADRDA
jgi:hypothetical protein